MPLSARRRRLTGAAAALCLLALLGWHRLAVAAALVAWRFADVPALPPAALAALRPPPVLLDVRSAAEFAVGHLPGATRLDLARPDEALRGVSAGRTVVVYCAVGYRSGAAARVLRARGFRDVRNLRGGIFAWADEGRAMTGDAGPTRAVHPYSRGWGMLRAVGVRTRCAEARGRARRGAAAGRRRR
ncbi:MAG: rhodanese-like domain-containing protein [Polyangiales bacterium]